MKISRERLSVIGRMIGIYREERRGNSQNSWTQIKFCEDICSTNTLKNIESGGVARSMEVYEQLLARFQLKLGEFPVIDSAIEELINRLYIAIEYFNEKEIDSITSKGIKILETAKDYVFYSELYTVFVDIRNQYLHYIIIEDLMVCHFKTILMLFNDKFKDMMILLMLSKVKLNGINNFPEYEAFVKEFKLEGNTNIVIELSVLHFYYVTKQRFKMMDSIEMIENKLLSTRNINRLVDAYSFAIVMLSDIDNSKSLIYIEKANVLLNKHILPQRKESELASNIASYYYNLKDYENALKFLEIAVKGECTDLLSNYIIMANCQNHLGISIILPKLSKSELKKYPNDLRISYQYFYSIQEDNMPNFVKIKMIMKHIVPIIFDKVLIDVFRYEISKLVEKTNSYKTMYLFEKEIENKFRS